MPIRWPHMFVWLALPLSVASAAEVDYVKQIKPVLVERCVACHGTLKQKSGLRLDAAGLILKGGDDGPVVVRGKPDESTLIHAITGTHDVSRMPKEGAALTDQQIETFRQWIEQGAKAPDEAPPPDPREHWSFRPPVRPAIPATNDTLWAGNPIDSFVAAEHRKRGLTPRPTVRKEILLRRVYLDLIGLPPTPAELDAFLKDESPDAYAKVVDRLLASPRYGERWGRHFMDVWRYSDWAGYQAEVRDSQPFLWRWRDWIVESLNEDKPYNRMATEMLAGDEIAPADPNVVRATGYLARSWYKFNRNVWLDNTIEHAGKAFLGLTFNCARCHDHKYDPIEQQDFYRLRAVFEPTNIRTDAVPGQADVKKDGLTRIFDEKSDAPTFLFLRGDEKQPDKEHPLRPGLPAFLGGKFESSAVNLPAEAWQPALRPFVAEDLLTPARKAVDAARAVVEKAPEAEIAVARAKLDAAEAEVASIEARLAADRGKANLPPGVELDELFLTAGRAERQAAVSKAEAELLVAEAELKRANSEKKDDAKGNALLAQKEKAATEKRTARDAARTAAKQSSAKYTPIGSTYPKTSTGRRTALARWITSRENPLAARVLVNHVWMRHFGQPLVPTVFDFGLKGKPPTHPELLDWLAVEFMEQGWSVKKLHRLIVTSQVYQLDSGQSADADAANIKADQDNVYLWRANVRRLEAEAVRDSLLYVSGQLDLTTGGPELDENAALTTRRRSIYYRHAHEKQAVFMQVFDAASPSDCYRRVQTIVPQQALALANSSLALAQARLLAGQLSGDATKVDNEAFVRLAYERLLSRRPDAREMEFCTAFLVEQARRFENPKQLMPFTGEAATVKPSAKPTQRARENLVHVLMNHNDFVTIR